VFLEADGMFQKESSGSLYIDANRQVVGILPETLIALWVPT
jgi:hypothetical protein